MFDWPSLLTSLGRRLMKETTRALALQAAQAASGVLRCTPCEFSCFALPEALQECPVSSEAELWVRFAPIGVLLFLLGFVVSVLVCGGKNRIVEVSYPSEKRRVGLVRDGTSRRPAAEDR